VIQLLEHMVSEPFACIAGVVSRKSLAGILRLTEVVSLRVAVFGSEGAIPAHKVLLPCSNINGRWGAGFDTGWAEIPCCVHLLSPSSPDGVRVLDCGRKPGTGIWPNAMHGKNKRDRILEYRYPESVGTGMHLFVEGTRALLGMRYC